VRLFWLGLGRWSTWLAFLGEFGWVELAKGRVEKGRKKHRKEKERKGKTSMCTNSPLCVASERASERKSVGIVSCSPVLLSSCLVLSCLSLCRRSLFTSTHSHIPVRSTFCVFIPTFYFASLRFVLKRLRFFSFFFALEDWGRGVSVWRR
jgi:hypothetical protein